MDEKLRKAWSEMNDTPYDVVSGMVRPRIHSDVPSFIDVPVAWEAADLEGLDAAFVGLPFEGWIHPAPLQWPTQDNPHRMRLCTSTEQSDLAEIQCVKYSCTRGKAVIDLSR